MEQIWQTPFSASKSALLAAVPLTRTYGFKLKRSQTNATWIQGKKIQGKKIQESMYAGLHETFSLSQGFLWERWEWCHFVFSSFYIAYDFHGRHFRITWLETRTSVRCTPLVESKHILHWLCRDFTVSVKLYYKENRVSLRLFLPLWTT